MTHSTYSLFSHSDMSRACPTTLDAIPKRQLSVDLRVSCLAEVCDNARFVEHGVRGTHATLEVELEFLHGLFVWDQFKSCISGESGAMFGKEIDCGVILGGVSVWRGEVEREEGEVDCVFFFSFLGQVDVIAVSVEFSKSRISGMNGMNHLLFSFLMIL